jgi:hypothetical protein
LSRPRSEWRFRTGAAGALPFEGCFLRVKSVTANEFLQRDADNTANCVEFEQIQATYAVLIFAHDGLAYAKGEGQVLLAESSFFSDRTQQREQYMLLLPTASQSWSALRHEIARIKDLDGVAIIAYP